jgi:hypothetical protein
MTSAEQEEEERTPEYDNKLKKEFSFPPGSSVPAIERNINSRRRKLPPEGVYPTLTTPIAPPPGYNSEVKVSTVEQSFPERCHRKVCSCGTYRAPYVRLPRAWVNSMEIDWKNKANGHDDVTLEFSEDRTEIRIRKTPAPPTMERNVDARIFEVDSDAAAELEELKNQGK